MFTSGATESNNMTIKVHSTVWEGAWSLLAPPSAAQGVARFYKAKKRHIITTQIVC